MLALATGGAAYVTVGGLNQVLAFRADTFERVAQIAVAELPHGIWPSGDGTRVYVGIENGDAMTAIDTLGNKVIATIPIGQAPQALVYVPNAVPEGAAPLEPLAAFMSNPAGSAIVNAVGPIRQMVQTTGRTPRRYLAIAAGTPDHMGALVQIQQ